MATPIAPTPELHGQAAIDFFTYLETRPKATEEEKKRIKENAEKLKKCLTFNF